MLLLVQLLEVDEGVLVLRIEAEDLVERLERPIDESAALVVEAEAEQHVGVLEPREPRALQQALVNGDRLADLALLAIQVAEDHVHFECVVLEAGGAAQFFDRLIDLVGDEEVQAEDVVRRLARAAAVEPLAVAQLVALPRLADGEPGQEREQARRAAARTRSCALAPPA